MAWIGSWATRQEAMGALSTCLAAILESQKPSASNISRLQVWWGQWIQSIVGCLLHRHIGPPDSRVSLGGPSGRSHDTKLVAQWISHELYVYIVLIYFYHSNYSAESWTGQHYDLGVQQVAFSFWVPEIHLHFPWRINPKYFSYLIHGERQRCRQHCQEVPHFLGQIRNHWKPWVSPVAS